MLYWARLSDEAHSQPGRSYVLSSLLSRILRVCGATWRFEVAADFWFGFAFGGAAFEGFGVEPQRSCPVGEFFADRQQDCGQRVVVTAGT